MSQDKKGRGNLRDECLPKNNPTAKKYHSQTTQSHVPNDEQRHDLKDCAETTKDSLSEILTQVIHKKSELDANLPVTVNKKFDGGSAGKSLPSTNDDHSENNDQKPHLEQTAGSPNENKIKSDLLEVAENKERREKFRREDLTKGEIEEICGKDGSGETYTKTRTPGLDPRFQQQNQTLRCFVMYTDFYRCEKILGEGEVACQWFKDVFTTICPLDWVRRWDEAREAGILPWMKGKTQGKFPGNRYGD